MRIPVANTDDFIRGKKEARPDKSQALSRHQTILLHSALYTVSFYKALWTSSYTSRAFGWGNPLAGECVTLLSNSAVTIIEES